MLYRQIFISLKAQGHR